MKTKLLLTLAWLFLSGTFLTAGEMVKQINVATKSEENKYYLVFCARGGSPTGHAFVAWGKDSFEAKACQASAFGLYPKGGAAAIAKSMFGPVPGKIVEESLASKTTYRLIVQVDSTQYAAAEKVRVKKWNTVMENKYELLVTDCTTFISDVAREIKLKRPERAEYMFPESFLREMIRLNQ
ncbi:MAG: hypothetical protein WCH99_10620 [Verrucomicrobiota bacterium]